MVGYYAVMPYFIEREILTKKQRRGLPDRIPCYLISKLALDNSLKGQRLGSQLLASALIRAAPAAAQIGGRYVVVDALNESARSFYLHHGFEAVEGRDDRLVSRSQTNSTSAAVDQRFSKRRSASAFSSGGAKTAGRSSAARSRSNVSDGTVIVACSKSTRSALSSAAVVTSADTDVPSSAAARSYAVR